MSIFRSDVAGPYPSAILSSPVSRKWRQAHFIQASDQAVLRLVHERDFLDRPLPPDARTAAHQITYGPDWLVSDSRLELYDKCLRRFFYTHVLGLGGARKATAFARTHDCLYELIRWLSHARLGRPAEADAEAASKTSGGLVVPRITPSRGTTASLHRDWWEHWCVLVRAAVSTNPSLLRLTSRTAASLSNPTSSPKCWTARPYCAAYAPATDEGRV